GELRPACLGVGILTTKRRCVSIGGIRAVPFRRSAKKMDSGGGQIYFAIKVLAFRQNQIEGTSTVFQFRSAELSTAASTKASPLRPSSTVGNGRSISSGGSCRILATTALAKSE